MLMRETPNHGTKTAKKALLSCDPIEWNISTNLSSIFPFTQTITERNTIDRSETPITIPLETGVHIIYHVTLIKQIGASQFKYKSSAKEYLARESRVN